MKYAVDFFQKGNKVLLRKGKIYGPKECLENGIILGIRIAISELGLDPKALTNRGIVTIGSYERLLNLSIQVSELNEKDFRDKRDSLLGNNDIPPIDPLKGTVKRKL